MTNREWLNSLPDEEFAKFLDIHDLRFIIPGFGPPHICDYKHEGKKRCKEMNDNCHACMVDFLRAEYIENKLKENKNG